MIKDCISTCSSVLSKKLLFNFFLLQVELRKKSPERTLAIYFQFVILKLFLFLSSLN